MIENLTAHENLIFLISLGMLGGLFVIELLALLSGMEVFGFLDGALPDLGDIGVDADIGADIDPSAASVGSSFLQGALAMLNLGRVPAIFSLLVFLFIFPFIGLNMQLALAEAGIGRLPLLVATPIAFIAALPCLRWANAILGKILPKDETSAISEKELVGRVAIITIGTVTHNRQSEARTEDQYGHHHYVQVVSDDEADTFKQGDHVLLAGRRGTLYTVIPVSNPNLEASPNSPQS